MMFVVSALALDWKEEYVYVEHTWQSGPRTMHSVAICPDYGQCIREDQWTYSPYCGLREEQDTSYFESICDEPALLKNISYVYGSRNWAESTTDVHDEL